MPQDTSEVRAKKAARWDALVAEGKSPDEAVAIVEREFQATAKPDVWEKSKSDLRVGLTSLQGLPFVGTLTDEAIGTAYGALHPKKNMQQGRDAVREAIARSRKERPVASLASEVGVGALGVGGLLKYAPKLVGPVVDRTASLLNRMKAGAKGGAAMGATAGFGAGEGGVTERLPGTMIGLGLGEGVGVASPVIGVAGRWAGRKAAGLVDKVKNRILDAKDPTRIAKRAFQEGLDVDDIDPVQLAAMAEKDDLLGDVVGPHTQATIRKAASEATVEGTRHNRMLAERELQRGTVGNELAQGAGVNPRQGNFGAKQDIDRTLGPKVAQGYEAVMEEVPDIRAVGNQNLERLLTRFDPDMDDAIKAAARRSESIDKKRWPSERSPAEVVQEGRHKIPLVGTAKETGKPRPTSVRDFDRIKKALDKFAQINKRDPSKGIGAAETASDLRSAIDEAVDTYQRALVGGPKAPSYATVRALAQKQAVLKNANDLGKKIARGAVDVRDAKEVIAAATQKLPPETATKFADEVRKAVAREMVGALGKQTGTEAEAVAKLLGSANSESLVRLAFPDEQSFAQFSEAAHRIMLKGVQRAAQSGNPQAIELASAFDALGKLTPWGLAQALRGSGALALAQAAGAVERAATQAMNKKAIPDFLRIAETQVLDPRTGKVADETMALFRELASMRQRGPRVASAPSSRRTALRRGVGNTLLGRFTGRNP